MAQEDFWSKIKQRIREVSTAAADFTEEQAVVGKLKFDILNLKRRIDKHQREIGARVCELDDESASTDILRDGEIKAHLKEIRALEKQVLRKRDEISKVADEIRSRGGVRRQEPPVEVAGKPAPKKRTRKTTTPRQKAARKASATRRKRTATKKQAGTAPKTTPKKRSGD